MGKGAGVCIRWPGKASLIRLYVSRDLKDGGDIADILTPPTLGWQRDFTFPLDSDWLVMLSICIQKPGSQPHPGSCKQEFHLIYSDCHGHQTGTGSKYSVVGAYCGPAIYSL